MHVYTDHDPATFQPTKTNLYRRHCRQVTWQARWSEYLQRFDPKWIYKPGRVNRADSLSRSPALAVLSSAPSRIYALPLLTSHGHCLGVGEQPLSTQRGNSARYGLALLA
jgi:hypothetical protein